MGGNGVTIEDCYFSSLDKGVVTYAQACLISRPIIELCHTGIETYGTTSIVAPWYDGTTDVAHVSVQPNTVGGGSSGTGALLLGYGSSGWNVKYGSKSERNRSLIVPERLDFSPGEDAARPRGEELSPKRLERWSGQRSECRKTRSSEQTQRPTRVRVPAELPGAPPTYRQPCRARPRIP